VLQVRSSLFYYSIALLAVSIAVIILSLLEQWLLPLAGTVLILLMTVLIVALLSSFRAAIFATLSAIAAFNFFFTEPRHSFHMTDTDEIVTTLVFALVALAASYLATAFRAQKEDLKQAQLRSSILLSVSHDLRTPLASIIGNLSTIQTYTTKLTETEKSELLQAALEESDRLHRYIENLLQATRIQHGEQKIERFEQSLGIIIAKAIKRLKSSERVCIKLPDQELTAPVQASLLEQALFNIIDNALQFSAAQEQVEVILTQQGPHAVIDVIDQGPGISKTEQSRIFELFYSSRKKDSGTGGIGLGLAVARGIVALHQGEIRLLDTPQGCHMQILIPLQPVSSGAGGFLE